MAYSLLESEKWADSPWQKSSGFNRAKSRLAVSACIDDTQKYRLLRPPTEATFCSISGRR